MGRLQIRHNTNSNKGILYSGEPYLDIDNNHLIIGLPSGEVTFTSGSGRSGISGTSGISGSSGTSGASGSSGTGFSTISNASDNNILTSNGSINAANAETNLKFDGTKLSLSGNLIVKNSTIPSSSGDTGEKGQITWDDSYIYAYTDEGWKRVPINETF